MRKFLGVSLAVGALTIVSGVAVAQLDHGLGHDVHGAKGHAMEAGHHDPIDEGGMCLNDLSAFIG